MKQFNVRVQIPDHLMEQLNKINFDKKKSLKHAIKLIAVVLYALNEEDVSPYDFYKPLSSNYISRKITSCNFYNKYFLKQMQGVVNEDNFNEKIFQTDGSYCVNYYEKHYRINPLFLDGPTKEYEVELELESLNDDFPEVISHFGYSTSLIEPKYDRQLIRKKIDQRSRLIGIMATGANSGFYNKSLEDFVLNSRKTFDLSSWQKHELEARAETKHASGLDYPTMLIQEINKKNKTKYTNMNPDVFLQEKRKKFLARVNKKVDQVISKEWMPNISTTNGRFNHLFTNIDKFCIDYFLLNGETIKSFDLKSSQPTILANLLIKNEKLSESLNGSKYQKMLSYLDKTKHLFFHTNKATWLNDFVHGDVYTLIAEQLNNNTTKTTRHYTRDDAKLEMMKLFFQEPNAPSIISEPLRNIYPEFEKGLRKVKHGFKDKFGSSKKTLPVFLQFVEAHIFLETIYSRIALAKIPALTKHDSILFPESRQAEIQSIINECFCDLGFKGKIVLEEKKPILVNVWPNEYFPSKLPI